MYDLGGDSEPGAPPGLAVSGGNLFVMKPTRRPVPNRFRKRPNLTGADHFLSGCLDKQSMRENRGRSPTNAVLQPLRLRLTSSTLGTFEPIIAVRDLGRELLGKPAIGRREFALLTQGSKNIQPLFVRCPGLDPILDSTPT